MTVTPTSRTVHPMPHQIAYTDASLAVQDVYALAAVVNGVTITTTARAHTTQQAELQAARLAVQHADPGPLHLHVDCLATVHVLTGLARSRSPLTEPARELFQLAAERGVALHVQWIPRGENAAHHPAHHTAGHMRTHRRARRVHLPPLPPETPGLVVRLRHHPDGTSARGGGLRAVAHGPLAALRILIDLAGRTPPGVRVRVRGVPPYAAHLWTHPEHAPDDLLASLSAARCALSLRGSRLHLVTP